MRQSLWELSGEVWKGSTDIYSTISTSAVNHLIIIGLCIVSFQDSAQLVCTGMEVACVSSARQWTTCQRNTALVSSPLFRRHVHDTECTSVISPSVIITLIMAKHDLYSTSCWYQWVDNTYDKASDFLELLNAYQKNSTELQLEKLCVLDKQAVFLKGLEGGR